MIPVCKDVEMNGDTSLWFYANGTYFRHDKTGTLKGRITGKNIPNPNEVWKTRCDENGAKYPCDKIPHNGTGEIIRLKPTEAAFKLFEHWQSVTAQEASNANNNN